MLIREAVAADLPKIVSLLQTMDDEKMLDLNEARKIWDKMGQYPNYKLYVAEEEEVVALCSLIIIDNLGHRGAKYGVADNVIVSPEYRGKGVGSRLMKFIMEKTRQENGYKLMLSSNKKRVMAHRFYKKLGFEQHGLSFMVEVDKND